MVHRANAQMEVMDFPVLLLIEYAGKAHFSYE